MQKQSNHFFRGRLATRVKDHYRIRLPHQFSLIYYIQNYLNMQKYHHIEIPGVLVAQDRKSTRLNSSHVSISYAVFCLKKKIECQSPDVLLSQTLHNVDLRANAEGSYSA